jgi:glycine betaine/proline transport system ATP-binding protein
LIRQEMQSEFLRLQAMLHKTIVFITHDFDEAIRLADRMAVMKDGEIVQIGTPEEFILNPANDYIREFTRDIPKEKVLRVRSICDPDTPPTNDVPLAADTCLHEVARTVISGRGHHPVVDADGTCVGSLHRDALGAYLL